VFNSNTPISIYFYLNFFLSLEIITTQQTDSIAHKLKLRLFHKSTYLQVHLVDFHLQCELHLTILETETGIQITLSILLIVIYFLILLTLLICLSLILFIKFLLDMLIMRRTQIQLLISYSCNPILQSLITILSFLSNNFLLIMLPSLLIFELSKNSFLTFNILLSRTMKKKLISLQTSSSVSKKSTLYSYWTRSHWKTQSKTSLESKIIYGTNTQNKSILSRGLRTSGTKSIN